MTETMTERFQFRLTPKLLEAIHRKAARLGLTPQSIVRTAVAVDVCGCDDRVLVDPSIEYNETEAR